MRNQHRHAQTEIVAAFRLHGLFDAAVVVCRIHIMVVAGHHGRTAMVHHRAVIHHHGGLGGLHFRGIGTMHCGIDGGNAVSRQ
ncbi:hypothetical protein D3C80_1984620 [compost metagenome]